MMEISLKRYDELLRAELELMFLENAICNAMSLSHYSNDLRLDDDKVVQMMENLEPTRVDATRRYLLEEREKKDAKLIRRMEDEENELQEA